VSINVDFHQPISHPFTISFIHSDAAPSPSAVAFSACARFVICIQKQQAFERLDADAAASLPSSSSSSSPPKASARNAVADAARRWLFLWFYKPHWDPDFIFISEKIACGPECDETHFATDPCLVCKHIWEAHDGHMCPTTGERGSFQIGTRDFSDTPVPTLQQQEQYFLKAYENVLCAINPESRPEVLEPRQDLFDVRCDRLRNLKVLVMKEAFGKIQNKSNGVFETSEGWSPNASTPSWLKVLAYVASQHFESESMFRKYHVSDVQAYFQCMLLQRHRCLRAVYLMS
jgi:hypothetical protein